MIDIVTKERAGQPEPWLRGTLTDVPVVIRAVLHALELAREDAERWCGDLMGVEVNAQPAGLPSVAFQLRHIAGSVDRLLTYAERSDLSEVQLAALAREAEGGSLPHLLLRDFSTRAWNAPASGSVALWGQISNHNVLSDDVAFLQRSVVFSYTLPSTRSGMSDK